MASLVGTAFEYHAFISHDWGDDDSGQKQGNHLRAKRLNESLQKRGLTTWFDEEQLRPGDHI